MTGFYTAVVAITAITASAVEQNKARQDQKRARKIAQKSKRLQGQRGAIEQVRQGQIARASVLQQGENQGVGNSTAIAGSAGAIQSQTGGNLAFAQQIFSLQQQEDKLREAAFGHMGRAANFQAVGSIATTALGAKGKTS